MARVIDRILAFLTPLLLFSANSYGKNHFDKYDMQKITNLDDIKLVSDNSPLVLSQLSHAPNTMLAGHSSHSSHSSHASHYSHRSSSTGSYTPLLPSQSTTPSSIKSTSPSSSSSKSKTTKPKKNSTTGTAWKASIDWKKYPNRLYFHEVLIILKNKNVIRGLVTDCRNDAIRITASDSTSSWVKLKNIMNLLWR